MDKNGRPQRVRLIWGLDRDIYSPLYRFEKDSENMGPIYKD